MAASAEAKAETAAERSPYSPLCFQVPSIPYDPNLQTPGCFRGSVCGCCMQCECVANTERWLSLLSGLDKLNNYKIYRFIKSTSPGCTQLFWQDIFLNSKSNLKHLVRLPFPASLPALYMYARKNIPWAIQIGTTWHAEQRRFVEVHQHIWWQKY